jgi:hypothetical protein
MVSTVPLIPRLVAWAAPAQPNQPGHFARQQGTKRLNQPYNRDRGYTIDLGTLQKRRIRA